MWACHQLKRPKLGEALKREKLKKWSEGAALPLGLTFFKSRTLRVFWTPLAQKWAYKAATYLVGKLSFSRMRPAQKDFCAPTETEMAAKNSIRRS